MCANTPDEKIEEQDEEETVNQKLMRFWKAGYVFSESEIKVLRMLSTLWEYKSPGPWKTGKD